MDLLENYEEVIDSIEDCIPIKDIPDIELFKIYIEVLKIKTEEKKILQLQLMNNILYTTKIYNNGKIKKRPKVKIKKRSN